MERRTTRRRTDDRSSVPEGSLRHAVRMPRSVQRAHRRRCYPTAVQPRRLEGYFGAARWVWNRALEYRTKAYRRRGESLSGTDFSRPAQSIRFQLDQRHNHRSFDANDRRLMLPSLGAG